MSVLVGSARSSYGNTRAGDQSGGREVSTQAWYLHSKGWVVLRPVDVDAADRIASAMRAACDNQLIGYDQDTRDTLYTAIKTKGYDPAKCTVAVNTDCSALVRICCCYAGILVGNFTTSNEASRLLETGAFKKLTDPKYTEQSAYLRRGDILVTRTKGHTVVVLTDGPKAEREIEKGDNTLTIASGSWNLREAPIKDDNVITVLHTGDKVMLLSDNGDWLNVRYGGTTGYVSVKAVAR